MPRLDRFWYELDAQTKGFDEGILRSGEKLKAFTEYARGAPIAVLGAFSAAAAAAAAVAAAKLAQMAASFDREMRKIQTVVQGSQAQLGEFGKGIQEIFRQLPIENIRELTQGLYDITSSGVPAGEALKFLETAAKAAVGGVTQVNVAVDGLTSAFNAFKEQGLSVEQISDQMFAAVAGGKTTFAELSQYMGQTAAVAAAANVPLRDMLAATAQLTLGGVKTADAMVGIKSAIVNILRPTDEFAKKYGDLAREFDRARLAQVGFIQFLKDLNVAAKGNSDVIATLFSDVQGFAAVSGLLKDEGAGVVDMLDRVSHSAGETSKAARTMSEGAAALNQQLKNELHVQLLDLGNSLLPLVNAGLQVATSHFNQATAAARALSSTIGELAQKGVVTGDVTTRATAQGRKVGDAATRLLAGFNAKGGASGQGGTIFEGISLADQKQLLANLRAIAEVDPSRATNKYRELLFVLKASIDTGEQAAEMQRKEQERLAGEAAKKAAAAARAAKAAEDQRKAEDEAEARAKKAAERLERDKAAAEQFARAMEDAADNATATAVDNLTREIDRLVEKTRPLVEQGLIDPFAVKRFEDLKRAIIETTRAAEETDAVLRAIDRPGGAEQGDFKTLAQQELRLRLQLDATKDADRRRELEEQIRRIQQRRLAIEKELAEAAKDAADEAEKQRDRLRDLAHTIESSARGALQLAEAFGIIDERTARVLANLVQIGANLPGLLSEIGKIGKEGFSGKALAAAALPVAGGIASIVSTILDSGKAFDAETKRLQRQNTEALEKLTDVIGEFGLAITGTQFSKGRTAGTAALEAIASGAINPLSFGKAVDLAKALDAQMRHLGVSLDDLRNLAGALGLTLDERSVFTLLQSLGEVVKAIQATELARFTETFEGQMTALNAQFKLFDITDPIAQLRELVKLFDNPNFGSPALREALAGLDLTTPEGRAAAQEAIQGLFRALQAGTLDPSKLGGLTPQQFLDQLLGIKELLDAGGGLDEGTGGYNVDRSITEATGSHLAGLLTTANVYHERTMLAAEAIARALLGSIGPLPSLQPPTLAAGSGGASGLSVVVNIGTVNVPAGVDPQSVGQQVGHAASRTISEVLGRELGIRRLTSGSVVVS